MSEIISVAVGGSIGALSGIMGTYAMAKHFMGDDKILEKIGLVIDEVAQNPDLQQKIYMIGGILGKGVADGTGIMRAIPKKKGGLEGMLFDLIGNFIGSKIGGMQTQQEQPVDVTPRPMAKRDNW